MRDWVAGVMLVLGTLLVLAGGAVVAVKALTAPAPAPESEAAAHAHPPGAASRLAGAVRRMTAADRLIAWGVVLLVIAAVAAGAISFNLGANAGTR